MEETDYHACGVWSQLWKRTEAKYTIMEQQLLAVYKALQQVESITGAVLIEEWLIKIANKTIY